MREGWVARNMLNEGFPIEVIARITGLNEDEVRMLNK